MLVGIVDQSKGANVVAEVAAYSEKAEERCWRSTPELGDPLGAFGQSVFFRFPDIEADAAV